MARALKREVGTMTCAEDIGVGMQLARPSSVRERASVTACPQPVPPSAVSR